MGAEVIDIVNIRNAICRKRYEEYDPELGLELAVAAGDLDGVHYLVEECGADSSKNRCYPLYVAAARNYLSIMKFLLAIFPIDVNANDGELLCVAAEQGSVEMVRYLIEEAGCDVNVCNSRPFLRAIQGGNFENIRLMIGHYGADDSQRLGETLAEAVIDDRLHIVRYLIEEVGVRPAHNGYDAVRLAWDCRHVRIAAYLSRWFLEPR